MFDAEDVTCTEGAGKGRQEGDEITFQFFWENQNLNSTKKLTKPSLELKCLLYYVLFVTVYNFVFKIG